MIKPQEAAGISNRSRLFGAHDNADVQAANRGRSEHGNRPTPRILSVSYVRMPTASAEEEAVVRTLMSGGVSGTAERPSVLGAYLS